MIIAYDNKYSTATLSATNENPVYPIENTQDIRLSRLFKTIDTSSVITVNPGTTISPTALFIANHNLDSSATVYLEGTDDNDFAMPKTVTHTLTSKLTIDCIVEPTFSYDTATIKYLFRYYLSSTQYFGIYYRPSADDFAVVYKSGGTERILDSQAFDDGASLTNLNQRLRITATIDLTTGTTAGSTLRVEPLESGSVYSDTAWPGNIDSLSATIPTLYIGKDNISGKEWEGNIEYLHIYDNQLLTSAQIDTGAYTPDYTQCKLPVDYASGIIQKLFTNQTHRYWRISITNNANFKIGGIYLGTYTTLANTFGHVLSDQTEDTTEVFTSLSGQTYTDVGYEYRVYELNFPYFQIADKAALNAILTAVRKRPVYVMLDETGVTEFEPIYCTITKNPYSRVYNDFYTTSMKLTEAK